MIQISNVTETLIIQIGLAKIGSCVSCEMLNQGELKNNISAVDGFDKD